jgi:hypothetical protein
MEDLISQFLNLFERSLSVRFNLGLSGRLRALINETSLEKSFFILDLLCPFVCVLDFLSRQLDLAVALLNLLLQSVKVLLVFLLHFPLFESAASGVPYRLCSLLAKLRLNF